MEAHATVPNPNSRAFVSATETTRSLKECVGFRVSSLIHRFGRPSSAPRRCARRSGVQPSPRSTRSSVVAGSSGAYRHRDAGPEATESRETAAAMAS